MFQHYLAARQELTAEGAPFAVTEIDVRGVPTKVFATAPPSMRSIWQLAAAHGDKPYLVYEDEHYSFAEIDRQVRALAAVLVAQGVGRGDRVAIAMRNYPEWIVGYWATVSLGAAVVGMNAWWTTAEMDFALRDSQPVTLIADHERVERVLPILDALRAEAPMQLIAVRTEIDLPEGSLRWAEVVSGDAPPLPDVTIEPDDDACIFYTSGTTGFPKGAQLTNRGSVHNLLNMAFMTTAVTVGEAKAVAAGDAPAPVAPAAASDQPAQPAFMAATPLFHVTANNCVMHPATLVGARLVLMYKWDPGRALELIERERITTFSGVPTMSREMLMHPDWERRDTSSLAGMGGGGAALQPDLVEKIDAALERGRPTTGYGLTETHGIVTANSSVFYVNKPASAGAIVPTLDAKLVDDEGNDIDPSPHAVGQLCVRGAVVIKGYLNRPEATADSIRDGWFNTGDIARIDEDGFVYIVDRAKDMVLRGGENVYCSEVEAAIYQHEAVAEAAVFGIPDERLGEEVAAAIVLTPGARLDTEALRSFLAERIAKHKIPATVWFLDEPLPRNANGKFVKRELRDKLVGAG